jgi:4-diphosphocytidyl-2-C-methyl-D-erythritol kinase
MRLEQQADVVVVHAPAKVNLYLEVLGKRADGYHDIETFMVAVDLFDNLEFRDAPSGTIELSIDAADLPSGPTNLVWQAATVLRRQVKIRRGASIRLSKRIPVGAGLAGGSTDAAATLAGLNRLWDLGLPTADLLNLAGQLGSDVAFFLESSAAWCTGRGEIVQPVRMTTPLDLVLACPQTALSTAAVYQRAAVPARPQDSAAFRAALAKGSATAIAHALFNRLQDAAEALCPEIRRLRTLFETIAPGRHSMTGSGSGYFVVVDSPDQARRLAQELDQRFRAAEWEPPPRVLFVRTLNDLDSSG